MTLKELRPVARGFDRELEEPNELIEDTPIVELRSGYRVYASKRPVHSPYTETATKRTSHESIKAERDVVDLLKRREGWDGYDAPKPKPESVAAAYEWVRGLYRDVRGVLWEEPLVTADEEGDVVFEWWRGRKKLTVYVSLETAEYVKVERRDIGTEMHDGAIETDRGRRELWNWLLS